MTTSIVGHLRKDSRRQERVRSPFENDLNRAGKSSVDGDAAFIAGAVSGGLTSAAQLTSWPAFI
jgi:hypothetical protein